jgi:hypothetical protein
MTPSLASCGLSSQGLLHRPCLHTNFELALAYLMSGDCHVNDTNHLWFVKRGRCRFKGGTSHSPPVCSLALLMGCLEFNLGGPPPTT